jgi:DNA-binding response OmpR family regulator
MASRFGLRVLLVGCSEEVARAVRDGGHDASSRGDSVSAVRDARACTPDVVILDLGAVPGDPLSLAREIRTASLWPKPLFVALVEGETAELEAQCKAAGIDLLFVKPLRPGLLAEFLSRLTAVAEEYRSFDPAI